MDFKKCNRCGSFYLSDGDVCPKCNTKDTFELSTFKSYIEENGCKNSILSVSQATGISMKHLNRYLGYEEFEEYANTLQSNNSVIKDKNAKKADLS